ncbi:MAG: PAS domain-containing sensor histidine kinase [Bacteroidales bacterium]|nr:PAS domain-containing sensor histidine kinase [Bacteroidales bacterium]
MTDLTTSNPLELMLMESQEKTKLSSLVSNHTDIKCFFDSLPYIALLLDSDRKIVYANEAFLQILDEDSISNIIDSTPGEVMQCTHSPKSGKECGLAKACNYCGMSLAIQHSKHIKGKVTRECLITRNYHGRDLAVDYQVTASTMMLNGDFYTMLTMTDISHEKRRRVLERIFFHDILNKAGSLSGIIDLVNNFDDENLTDEHLKIAGIISNEILEEIESQRLLMDAELGELEVQYEGISTKELIELIISVVKQHNVAKDKTIVIDGNFVDIRITSDPLLLKRVLINMIKNALEATSENKEVSIGCRKNGNVVLFWVNNKQVMPESVQLQIFHRSFSTKGRNRGLGTYSMKLLAEQYLQGRVFFESKSKIGTTFYLALPITKGNFEA